MIEIDECSCDWGGPFWPVMTKRDAACSQHGDDSPFWKRIGRRAQELAKEYGRAN